MQVQQINVRMLSYLFNAIFMTAKRHYHPDERDGDTTKDQIPYIARLMLQYGVSYECYHDPVVKQLPRSHKVQ